MDDLVDALARTRLLHKLPRQTLADLQSEFELQTVDGGATLMRQGDEADGLFLLLRGRLRAYIDLPDGREKAVGEILPGESVGELAILLDEPRSATVRAVRDSTVVKFSQAAVAHLLDEQPRAIMGVVMDIVRRAKANQTGGAPQRPVSTIALVPAGAGPAPTDFAHQLRDVLEAHGTVTVLRSSDRSAFDGEPDHRVQRWLETVENDHDFVLFCADAEDSRWTRRCLRQADRVLWVAHSDDAPDLGPVEHSLHDPGRSALVARQDLVLLHRNAEPSGSAAFLTPRTANRHHHVRAGRRDDLDRLARGLAGGSVGIVLSGGGARGLAHIGVIEAIRACGIPIDAIGGVSMGSIMAAQFASGMDAEAVRTACRQVFVENRPMRDKTLPLVSLMRGLKVEDALKQSFGESRIEDLPLPFFCCSSNLSKASLVTHDRGLVRYGIRASMAIPGVFPPVPVDGDLLVDGGVINNGPVNILRQRFDGRVILSDVGADSPPKIDPTRGRLPGGWSLLWRRIWPFAEAEETPGIVDILYRTAVLGSTGTANRMRQLADLVVRPPVARFKTLEFDPIEELVRIGRDAAKPVLEDWLESLERDK
jgi:predicted acylesterase/phospholipase RssA